MGNISGKRSECVGKARVLINLYPYVVRGVFGPSPGEIFDWTRGTVTHFYYAYLMGSVWISILTFTLLTAAGISSDPAIKAFLIDMLAYGEDNWLVGALGLILISWLSLALLLRTILYPIRLGGNADWRWKKQDCDPVTR